MEGRTSAEKLESQTRMDIIREQRAWHTFAEAGLPVPSFSKVDLRVNKPTYLARFIAPAVRRKRLIKIHDDKGLPTLLEKLSVKRDHKLINALAKDLATINNLGYLSEAIDFWELYRKGNTFERVIIDFGSFKKMEWYKSTHNPIPRKDWQYVARFTFRDLAEFMHGPEFVLFMRKYLSLLKEGELKQYAEDKYGGKTADYWEKERMQLRYQRQFIERFS